MTSTSAQQAAASAQQIIRQGNAIIAQVTAIKKVIDSGSPANAQNNLAGFTPIDLASALGTVNLGVINALIAALPAS